MLRWILLLGLIVQAAVAPVAAAQAPAPAEVLERLFREQPALPEWFAPEFLAQVPAAQIDGIIAGLLDAYGTVQEVRPEEGRFLVVLAQGEVPAHITLDGQGRILGLFFEAPRARSGGGLQEAVAAFRELPGRVSLLVLENGRPRVSLQPDEPLAVGSAFKLAVLAALQEQVARGERRWDEVVTLRSGWKSLPTGILQTWPDGAPLTLYALAALMISQSDNTATDGLIHLVGREAVEAWSPRNRPFLTTREAFVLKANDGLLERYRKADEAGRRALLPETAALPLPPLELFAAGPVALDVEWFFTAGELCALMEQVQGLPLMGINPGVADPEAWDRVAFKGGSEPGVINLTTALVGAEGTRYCVAATWNTEEPPAGMETRFVSLYTNLLAALAE